MIVSHKHKFIFIKTRKTAGTSLEIALSKICGPKDIITPISPNDEMERSRLNYPGPQNCNVRLDRYLKTDFGKLIKSGTARKFINHMEAKRIKRYVGTNVWDGYYKFCFDRHPFDKVISMYYWELSLSPKSRHMTFDEFLQSPKLKLVVASDLYCIDGVNQMDNIYHFERMSESLSLLTKKLNLNETIEMPVYQAKSSQRKDAKISSNTLTETQKEIIGEIFESDFKFSNYV